MPKEPSNSRPKVLYVTYSDVLGNVFSSQLRPLWAALAREGVDLHVFSFLGPKAFILGEFRRKWKSRVRESPVPIRTSYVGAGFPPRWPGLVERAIRSEVARLRPAVIHARGPIAAGFAARAISGSAPSLLFDVRGDSLAEIAGGDLLSETVRDGASRTIEALEKEACQRAHALISVSSPLASLMRDRYHYTRKIHVVPCWAEAPGSELSRPSLRDEVRSELGVASADFLWCYIGSAAHWQAIPEMLSLVGRLPAHHRLLIVTDDPASFPENDRRIVRSGNRSSTLRWLAGADAAILLRERHPINAVASPMKLGDYLAMGIPVLMSDGIGDASGWVRQANAGETATSLDMNELLRAALHLSSRVERGAAELRKNAKQLYREKLALDRFVPEYIAVYREGSNR